jgi:hypothetical protein
VNVIPQVQEKKDRVRDVKQTVDPSPSRAKSLQRRYALISGRVGVRLYIGRVQQSNALDGDKLFSQQALPLKSTTANRKYARDMELFGGPISPVTHRSFCHKRYQYVQNGGSCQCTVNKFSVTLYAIHFIAT